MWFKINLSYMMLRKSKIKTKLKTISKQKVSKEFKIQKQFQQKNKKSERSHPGK